MESSNKFRKSERLCSKKDIQSLFEQGNSFGVYPFRLIWLKIDDETNDLARIVVSIPKRRFKRAVKRNLLRRRIKESYRLRKGTFYEELTQLNTRVNFVVIYTGDKVMSYHELDRKITSLLARFLKEIIKKA